MKKKNILIICILSCLSIICVISCLLYFSRSGIATDDAENSVSVGDDSKSETKDESGKESGNEAIEYFTVSFDTAGGTEIKSQEVKAGELTTIPQMPQKSITVLENGGTIEYEFIGWFLGEEEYDFSSAVTEDMTLVAEYREIRLSPELGGRH